ncbi:hypothetical protein [Haliangium sp.]|uniref:hypothetical protein n=1 Tax=Haliangium sp. TaxID=2663208 RepID=UPI003D153084
MPRPRPAARPAVGDYVVEPETDTEMLDGEVRRALPAGPAHGDRHIDVGYVLRAHLAPGYIASADLLTRQSESNNFASDACIRKQGRDPDTGDRYLEELAFEIKATQRPGDLTRRARIMSDRGVRRVFAIWVAGDPAAGTLRIGPLQEWSPDAGTWRTCDPDEDIVDECLRKPLPVRALLDAAQADHAVARALIDADNPEIVAYGDQRAEAGYNRGATQGALGIAREALRLTLQARGFTVDERISARIEACSDLAVLKDWLVRAARADSVDHVFAAQ